MNKREASAGEFVSQQEILQSDFSAHMYGARIREISTVQFAPGHVFIQHHVVREEFLSSELEA